MSEELLVELECKKKVKRRKRGQLLWEEYRNTEHAGMGLGKLEHIWS